MANLNVVPIDTAPDFLWVILDKYDFPSFITPMESFARKHTDHLNANDKAASPHRMLKYYKGAPQP